MRWLCLVFLLGCNVPQDIRQQAPGLWTNGNKFAAPAGSLSKADNARCERPGLYSQRRGFSTITSGLTSVGSIFEHDGGDPDGPALVIQYSNVITRNGVAFDGSDIQQYVNNDPPTTYAVGSPPTRFVEILRRLYATTDMGVRRFEYDAALESTNDAGINWAPDILTTSAASASGSGFLANGASVIYRVTYGHTDLNGQLVLGAPSAPITITNGTGGAANVSLSLIAPSPVFANATTSLTYYLYRSVQVVGSPSDDVFLAAQGSPGVGYGSTFSITDSTPDLLLGSPLYTNATQEGELAANFAPPYASDLVQAFNKLFFIQTRQRPAFQLTLLATSPLRVGDILSAANNTFTFSSSTTSLSQIKLVTGGSVFGDIDTTARNIANAISMAEDIGVSTPMFAHYISATGDAPGQVWVEAVYAGDPVFPTATITAPTLTVAIGGLVRSGGTTVTATTSAVHNLSTGDVVTVTCADPNYSTGSRTVASTPTTTSFTYAQAGTNVASLNAATVKRTSPNPSSALLVDMSPQTRAYQKNGLAWSKDGEPDAVPEINYTNLGGRDHALLRGVFLRDTLFLFKEDGLWRANDDGQGGISIAQISSDVLLRGNKLVAVCRGALYAFIKEGVAVIGEGGVSRLVSTAVNQALIIDSEASTNNFMWADNKSGQLYIETDTAGWTYSVANDAWTRRTRAFTAAYISKSPFVRYPGSDAGPLFVGTATGSILLERPTTGNSGEFRDEGGAGIPFDIKFNPSNNPFTNKHFAEAQVLLQDSTASAITAKFSTDQVTTEQTVSATIDAGYANGPVRVTVPQETARGTYLEVGVAHSVASEQINVAGVEVDTAEGSGRTRQ